MSRPRGFGNAFAAEFIAAASEAMTLTFTACKG